MPVSPSNFWSELKRRRVVRLALVYLIAAWVIIEVSSTVFPSLSIPDWALSLLVVLLILGFPLSLTLAWAFDLTADGIRRTPAAAAAVATETRPIPTPAAAVPHGADPPATTEGPAEKSIAVLPFVNMSDDRENEYFSDGMTEELLNALVRVRELRVASRTSSFALKGKELDIHEIADKLHVAHVLEGSVRKSGDRIRITAQLIDARMGYHIWSESYDRDVKDVFRVQDEIARAIVDALKVQFGGDDRPLVEHATDDLEAYTLYLKGRFHYHYQQNADEDLRTSIDRYRDALRKDPGYARAWAGIADSWMMLADDWVSPNEAYPKAKEASLKALALDPALAEAHTALGKVLGWYDWDFDAAELALRRAVSANPKYPDAHHALGTLLPANGRLEEGLEELRMALALDPLSSYAGVWVARFLMYLRRYDECLDKCAQVLSLGQQPRPYLYIGQIHLARGQAEQALESFRQGGTIGDIAHYEAFAATALAAAGRVDEAREIVIRLQKGEDDRYVRPEALAMVYGALGDMDRAFQLLDQAIAARSAGLIFLHIDPAYDSLRPDPRFEPVVRRLGLRAPASHPLAVSTS